LTGLKVAKGKSSENNDEWHRLNSMAQVEDDNQDLQALYQNLASANEKNSMRNRQEVEDIKKELMESQKEQYVLSEEMIKLANGGGMSTNVSKNS
jgi:Trp operon repressor